MEDALKPVIGLIPLYDDEKENRLYLGCLRMDEGGNCLLGSGQDGHSDPEHRMAVDDQSAAGASHKLIDAKEIS